MSERNCAECGATKNLATHHLNKRHHDNRPENRIVLCDFCHTAKHIKGFKRFEIGDRASLEVAKGFWVTVKVKAIKSVFGMVRYIVVPISGKGQLITQKIQ